MAIDLVLQDVDLHEAAARGDVETVSLFKRNKEKINATEPATLRTLLHCAAWRGQHAVAALIVKAAKGEVDPLDIDRNTPLNLAILAPAAPLSRKLLVTDLLLSHGADPTLPNNQEETPFMNLMQMSRQIGISLFHHREVLRAIMRKVDENIRAKADRLNRSVSVQPGGVVRFEKITVPFAMTPAMPGVRF